MRLLGRGVYTMKWAFVFLVVMIFLVGCAKQEIQHETPKDIPKEPMPAETSVNESPKPVINCSSDTDCPARVEISKNCDMYMVYTTYNESQCVYPGTEKSYCKSIKSKILTQTCDTSNEKCQQGICVSQSFRNCTDEDGGKNYEDYSDVTDLNHQSFSDECVDDKNLKEYYCADNNKDAAYIIHECPVECRKGRCTD